MPRGRTTLIKGEYGWYNLTKAERKKIEAKKHKEERERINDYIHGNKVTEIFESLQTVSK